eukprot:1418332-Prorocentrum_lima.AAC.1
MHRSRWLMMKGPRPREQQILADPVRPSKFADSYIWVNGTVKGNVAIFVDDHMQAGHKASNIEFSKALENHWVMSTPEHLGPQDPYEKL